LCQVGLRYLPIGLLSAPETGAPLSEIPRRRRNMLLDPHAGEPFARRHPYTLQRTIRNLLRVEHGSPFPDRSSARERVDI